MTVLSSPGTARALLSLKQTSPKLNASFSTTRLEVGDKVDAIISHPEHTHTHAHNDAKARARTARANWPIQFGLAQAASLAVKCQATEWRRIAASRQAQSGAERQAKSRARSAFLIAAPRPCSSPFSHFFVTVSQGARWSRERPRGAALIARLQSRVLSPSQGASYTLPRHRAIPAGEIRGTAHCAAHRARHTFVSSIIVRASRRPAALPRLHFAFSLYAKVRRYSRKHCKKTCEETPEKLRTK